MTTISLNLDVWQVKNTYVKANLGEVNSRFLEVTLTDKSVPINLTGKTVVFYATKPDGNVIYNLCTIEDAANGVISVCLTSQMSSAAGKMPCEVHIIAEDKATLKAVGLELEIFKCADVDGAVESTSEFTALQEAMAEYVEASEKIDAHVANKSNPHEVTIQQIGAAAAEHTHSQYLTAETDPIFTASAASGITAANITTWNNKSDFSGDYTDLTNKPTIPTALSDLSGTLAISQGGTGASTAAEALSALGAQASTDNSLSTTAKTIVGAINELYATIDGFVDGDEVNY